MVQEERAMVSWDGGSDCFLVLRTFLGRARGLLGSTVTAAPVALVRCRSIHTFGMGYPIDTAFLNEDGVVVTSVRGLAPCRVLNSRGAWMALERPVSEGSWPTVNQVVDICWRAI